MESLQFHIDVEVSPGPGVWIARTIEMNISGEGNTPGAAKADLKLNIIKRLKSAPASKEAPVPQPKVIEKPRAKVKSKAKAKKK